MAAWLRFVLWVAVMLVPGGLLLLPVLLVDALQRRPSQPLPALVKKR